MANWKYRLELANEWQQAKTSKLTPKHLGSLVAQKARKLTAIDPVLWSIAAEFEKLSEDATFDDFDDVLEQLYDWADQPLPPYGLWPRNKMCWVATS